MEKKKALGPAGHIKGRNLKKYKKGHSFVSLKTHAHRKGKIKKGISDENGAIRQGKTT